MARSAGAAKSSQPIVAVPKSACWSAGSGVPVPTEGGVAPWSACMAGSTWRSPQTKMQSRITSPISPAVSQDCGASAATTAVAVRQAPPMSRTPAPSPSVPGSCQAIR